MLPVVAFAFLVLGVSVAVAWLFGGRQGSVSPLAIAVVLNGIALLVPLTGSFAFLLIPLACALIAAPVAAASRRWPWFSGTLASPWFLVPDLIWWAATASPDQAAAYGRVPWSFVGLAFVSGGFGAFLGCLLRWSRSRTRRESTDPNASASP